MGRPLILKHRQLTKQIMKNRIYFLVTLSILLACKTPEPVSAQRTIPVPNPRQVAWQEAELGAIFHYDLHVFDGKKYNQAENRIVPIPDPQIFNPEKLNVEQWVLAAKAMGARFALITATHETGFAIYPSDVNPYSTKMLKWKDGKGDLLRDFVDACRKHGLKPGVYIGIRWNALLGVHNFQVNGTGPLRENRQRWYNSMVEGMVEEICTRYGELFEIWFDGGAGDPAKGAPDVLPIVQKFQPNALFYHNMQLAEARWGGSESGTVGYPCWSTFPHRVTGSGEDAPKDIALNNYALLKHGDPDGKYYVPAMADAPLRGYNGRHEWFWEPGDEHTVYPVSELMKMYYQSVGRNATLIMGLTPDADGLMPQGDVDTLAKWGRQIQAEFGTPIQEINGGGKQFELKFGKNVTVQAFTIREQLETGHRVNAFTVEARVGNRWQKIGEGTAIGNKYIGKLEKPVQTSRLRLKVNGSWAPPQIRQFAAF